VQPSTSPQVGKTYHRRGKAGHALVVRVLSVGEWVEYEVIHGPKRALALRTGRCKARNFAAWEPIKERDDYSHLDGCKLQATFVVLDTGGTPILRCSQKRARFYLKKGLVRPAGEGTLQFVDDQTERRLRDLYSDSFSEFFMAVKNDRCVCCGTASNLTRHHVIPRRHRKKVPLPWRRCLSNVLFVCTSCHTRYEATPEPDPEFAGDWQDYARRWRQHFLDTLRPQHMPAGWDIISVTNLEALREWGGSEAG
jgi:hypothetical protein